MKIRLTRKLANALNGMDLRSLAVGDEVELHDGFGQMLIAERWAEEVATAGVRPTADERRRRPRAKKGANRRKPSNVVPRTSASRPRAGAKP